MMKLLYVEDDIQDMDLTRRKFARTAPDIEMQTASSYQDALALLRVDPPPAYDVILTDLHLRDGSGLSVLALVRERNLPSAVVVITGQGDEDAAVAALKAGADDYIVKRQDYLDELPTLLVEALSRFRSDSLRRARPLHVLYVEHNSQDIDLTEKHFLRHAPHIHLDVAHSAEQMLRLLNGAGERKSWDVLLIDYRLPGQTALSVVKNLRLRSDFHLPVVLITGHGDEETAVQALKLGVFDYVIKDSGYLYRLPTILEGAFYQTQLQHEQAALRESERRFRALIEKSSEGIALFAADGSIIYQSPSVQSILGYLPEEMIGKSLAEWTHPDDQAQLQLRFKKLFEKPGNVDFAQFRAQHADGSWRWLEAFVTNLLDEPAVRAVVSNYRDITERKQAQEQLQKNVERLAALRKIDEVINSTLDLDLVLQVVLEQVLVQLHSDVATIFLADPAAQTLQLAATRGFQTWMDEPLVLNLGEGFVGHVAATGKMLVFGDIAEELKRTAWNRPVFSTLVAEEHLVAYSAAPLVAKGQVNGVLEVFHRTPFAPGDDWLEFLQTLAGQAAIAINNAALFKNQQELNEQLIQAYDSTIEGWSRALDLRDKETEGHTLRVTDIALKMAAMFGISKGALVHVRRGALLHDIGKMGIPDDILQKPGPLTPEEWIIMRKHPVYAYDLIAPIQFLQPALDIPYGHHEKWDGSGYPRGLVGDQIPLAARIFALVDVWDALTSDRPYRAALSKAEALDYITTQSGRHFDPLVVAVFIANLEELIREL